jgi:c-di-GMP-binding flagellar brake protein YcgR
MSTAHAIDAAPQLGLLERRQHPRIKAAIPVELRPEGSETSIDLQTSDISLGGCYVQMIFTLEVGRMLELVLSVKNHKLPIRAVVVSRHPQVGNGIMFLEMEREDRIRLQHFLKSLLEADRTSAS